MDLHEYCNLTFSLNFQKVYFETRPGTKKKYLCAKSLLLGDKTSLRLPFYHENFVFLLFMKEQAMQRCPYCTTRESTWSIPSRLPPRALRTTKVTRPKYMNTLLKHPHCQRPCCQMGFVHHWICHPLILLQQSCQCSHLSPHIMFVQHNALPTTCSPARSCF